MKKNQFTITPDLIGTLATIKVFAPKSNVTLTGEGSVIRIHADDTLVQVHTRLPATEDGKEFQFCFSLDSLLSAVQFYEGGVLTVRPNEIVLKLGDEEMSRSTTAVDFSPEFPEAQSEAAIPMTYAMLEIAGRIRYAVCQANIGDLRQGQEVVFLTEPDSGLQIMACDGYRYAFAEFAQPTDGTVSKSCSFSLSQDAIHALLKTCEKDTNITLYSLPTKNLIHTGKYEIAFVKRGKMLDPALVKTNLAEMPAGCLTVDKVEITSFLQRVSLLIAGGKEPSGALRLEVQGSSMRCSYKSRLGRLHHTIRLLENNGVPDMEIGMNPGLFYAACTNTKGTELRMHMSAALQPLYISEGLDDIRFVHCVLPVRIKKDDRQPTEEPKKDSMNNDELAAMLA